VSNQSSEDQLIRYQALSIGLDLIAVGRLRPLEPSLLRLFLAGELGFVEDAKRSVPNELRLMVDLPSQVKNTPLAHRFADLLSDEEGALVAQVAVRLVSGQ